MVTWWESWFVGEEECGWVVLCKAYSYLARVQRQGILDHREPGTNGKDFEFYPKVQKTIEGFEVGKYDDKIDI